MCGDVSLLLFPLQFGNLSLLLKNHHLRITRQVACPFRPSGIRTVQYTNNAPQALAKTRPDPARHGRKLFKLVWTYFFSGVEIFRLECGNFIFSFLSYNRSEKCPHQRREKIHTRDKNCFTPETTNFHTKEHV